MKKTIASALFMAAVMTAPLAQAQNNGIRQFTVNDISVYPMMDSAGQMNAGLFSGPLSESERLAYMPGGAAPSSVNVFLLKTQEGNILIDAGWGLSGPGGAAVTELLGLSGVTADDIGLVLLTHTHSDHIGGLLNGSEAFFKKAKVMLSAAEFQAAAPNSVPAAAAAETPAPLSAPPPAAPPNEMFLKVLAAYGSRVESFEYGDEIVPGLTALKAPGHTPGHTAFSLKNGGREILFVGDLLHAAALQFPEPEECAGYDNNKEQAVATRKAILSLAAEKNLPIAGAHIPFPGTGFVKTKDNGFIFEPLK